MWNLRECCWRLPRHRFYPILDSISWPLTDMMWIPQEFAVGLGAWKMGDWLDLSPDRTIVVTLNARAPNSYIFNFFKDNSIKSKSMFFPFFFFFFFFWLLLEEILIMWQLRSQEDWNLVGCDYISITSSKETFRIHTFQIILVRRLIFFP